MRRFTLMLVFALTFTSLARADNAVEKAQATALAKQMLPADRYKKMMDTITAAISSQEPPDQKSKHAADFWTRFRSELGSLLTYDEMITMEAGLLVKYYKPAELSILAKFYKTPLGQKTLEIMPSVASDVMVFTQGRLRERLPGVLKRLDQEDSAQQSPASSPGK